MTELFQWLPQNLAKIFESRQVQDEVGKRLAAVSPKIRWEAGPFDKESTFFAFSPNFDPDLLPLTEELAKAAPPIAGWVFLPAKPRKRWTSRSMSMTDSEGITTRYEMDDWRYFLTSFKNGEFFDVNLVPAGPIVRSEDLPGLGEFLVQSELGEKVFLEFIDRVNIVSASKLEQATNNIEDLHDHLLQQLAEHSRH